MSITNNGGKWKARKKQHPNSLPVANNRLNQGWSSYQNKPNKQKKKKKIPEARAEEKNKTILYFLAPDQTLHPNPRHPALRRNPSLPTTHPICMTFTNPPGELLTTNLHVMDTKTQQIIYHPNLPYLPYRACQAPLPNQRASPSRASWFTHHTTTGRHGFGDGIRNTGRETSSSTTKMKGF